MAGENHIRASARLRGQGDFVGAIDEIEANRPSFDDVTLVPALLQTFYAAVAAGMTTKATELARELATMEPEIPSIQRFL